MKQTILATIAVLVVVAATFGLTAQPAFGQAAKKAPVTKSWTPSETPWGDPDLQGTWTSDDCIRTPLNRPANLGDRLYYTEQELADREGQIVQQQERDRQDYVAPDQRVGTGPPNHWGDRAKRPCKQTSLVVDPTDGRVPDMLPEAKARPIPEGANNNNPKADSWEDFSYYIRCISRGVTGSIFPVVYGNGQQIVQAPGYVTILEEMVHEARVIPLEAVLMRAPTSVPTWATHAATGRAVRWLSRPRTSWATGRESAAMEAALPRVMQ
jgi:hypothetical protein